VLLLLLLSFDGEGNGGTEKLDKLPEVAQMRILFDL
jgi:hypothetical protein